MFMAVPMLYTALCTPLFIGLFRESSWPIFLMDRIIDSIFVADLVRISLLPNSAADRPRMTPCACVRCSCAAGVALRTYACRFCVSLWFIETSSAEVRVRVRAGRTIVVHDAAAVT